MTPRQRLFAEQYAIDHNGTAAAVRAGYAQIGAHVTASRLLRKPKVASIVAEHEKAAAQRLAVNKERVITELEAAIDLARQKGDPMAMIRGWAEIAKLIGAYAPERKKVEITLDGQAIQATMAAMSDGELLAIAQNRL